MSTRIVAQCQAYILSQHLVSQTLRSKTTQHCSGPLASHTLLLPDSIQTASFSSTRLLSKVTTESSDLSTEGVMLKFKGTS